MLFRVVYREDPIYLVFADKFLMQENRSFTKASTIMMRGTHRLDLLGIISVQNPEMLTKLSKQELIQN
jgi:hypothetical protein